MDDRGDDDAPLGLLSRAGANLAPFSRLWLSDLAAAGRQASVHAARRLWPARAGRSRLKAGDGTDGSRAATRGLDVLGGGGETVRLNRYSAFSLNVARNGCPG